MKTKGRERTKICCLAYFRSIMKIRQHHETHESETGEKELQLKVIFLTLQWCLKVVIYFS